MANIYILETNLADPNIFSDTELYESWLPVNNAEYCVEETGQDFIDAVKEFNEFYATTEKVGEYFKIDIQNFIDNIEKRFERYKKGLRDLVKAKFDKLSDFDYLHNYLSPLWKDMFIYDYSGYYTPYARFFSLKPELEKLLKEKKDLYLIQVFRYKI